MNDYIEENADLTRENIEDIKVLIKEGEEIIEGISYEISESLGEKVEGVANAINNVIDTGQNIVDTFNNFLDANQNNDVTRNAVMYISEILKGDHLKTERIGYTHHSIYMGDGKVIHYLQDGVTISSYEEFADNSDVYILTNTESPTFYNSDEIVERGLSRLGENDYNLLLNNCEHFARWCRSGVL